MCSVKRATVMGIVGLLAFQGASARADEPATQELIEQIRALESKVAALESKQNEQVRSIESAAAVDATVERMLRDADRRSQMLVEVPFTSGWEKGKFLLRSEDGNFVLHPWLQFQFRYVATFREGANGEDDDTQSGFELRRMKLGFDGNVFSPRTTYQFLWGTNRKDGSFQLEEAWVKHALGDEWSVSGGQFKSPFAHESLVSSKRLMAADRTIVTNFFTGGDNFVQGVAMGFTRDVVRVTGAFHDGARNNFNQNFQDFPTNNANYGGTGRMEYKFAGDWKSYDDFTALGTKNDTFVIGGGLDYTEAGNTQFFMHTIDAQYETAGGLGLYAAYIGRNSMNAPTSAATAADEADLYDWGVVLQTAFLMKNNWEPFVRYDLLSLDEDGLSAGAENEVHSFAAGANYYWHGHDAKFTLDGIYLPNGSPISDDGAGILANDGESEFVFRAQFQLLL